MLNHMKIRTQVLAVLACFLAVMLAVGGLGVYSMKSATTMLENTQLKDTRVSALVERMRFKMEVNRSQVLQALQHNPAMEWHKLHDHPLTVHYKIVGDTTQDVKALWDSYQGLIETPEEKQLADKWYADSGKLGVEPVTDAIANIQKEDWDAAETVLIKRLNPGYRVSDDSMKALNGMLAERGRANASLVQSRITSTGYLMLAVMLIGAVLAATVGLMLIRGITTPLEHAVDVARRVAKGDLRGQIEVSGDNEIGQLLQALKDMDSSLAHIVHDVREVTSNLDGVSRQIVSGNQELAERTTSQAGALDATASSMEELTGTVRQNGDNARQANQLALSAATVASKGGAVVSQVVTTMGSINESARKIVDIIGVIDGIAFQTNILALNAAVEAARAGEQGRGFAVVAGEVRNLAQRSAAAAKEIKSLIDDSVEKVELGARLVDQAGTTMADIVSSVQRVTDIMTEITSASEEQSEGIAHINEAIQQMDGALQQNTALVEDASSAADSLHEQTRSLVQLVSIFQLNDSTPVAANLVTLEPRRAPARVKPGVMLTRKVA